MNKTLHDELAELLNRHSAENGSNTPDWVLGNDLRTEHFRQPSLRTLLAGLLEENP